MEKLKLCIGGVICALWVMAFLYGLSHIVMPIAIVLTAPIAAYIIGRGLAWLTDRPRAQ